MALSQKHRTSIYSSLVPILGEEEAEALMQEFPATERDELVTRSMLLATETTLRGEIAEVRVELAGFRADVADRFRQQTVWLSTLVIGAVGVSTTLASIVG